MSDYSVTTVFSDKDSLPTNDPEKLILGSDFSTEFNNIATAVATKYDSGDIASQAQAEAATSGSASNAVLLTPLRLWNWASDNAGIVEELQTLADPAADRIFFWDDGEAAGSNVAFLTVGNGLEISTTTLGIADAAAGAGLTASSGVLAVGGGNGITANANDVALTDQSVSTSVPVGLSSGSLTWDPSSLTAFGTSAGVDLDADHVVLEDAGTAKLCLTSQLVTPEVPSAVSGTTDSLTEADFGKVLRYSNATCTVTLPNGLKSGFWATLLYTGTPGAGLVLSATSTLNTAGSLTTCTQQHGAVTVFHVGSNVWYAWGALDS